MARQREPSRDPRSVLQEHRAARLGERQDVQRAEGERPHLHVPNELLVGRDDLPLVESDLRELGAQELPVPAPLEARLLRFEVPAGEPLTALVARTSSFVSR